MTTQLRQDGDQTIYWCPETRAIPELDIQTFLLDSPHTWATDDDAVLHAPAANPSMGITKKQMVEELQQLAHLLRHRFGIGAQGHSKDVVSTIFTGHHLAATTFHGVVAAGGVFAGTNATATVKDLANVLKECSSKLLICTDATKQTAVGAAKQAGLAAERVLVLGNGGKMELFEASSSRVTALDPRKKLAWERPTSRQELERRVACLLFSSGTTGLPKAVQTSHYNVVAASYLTHRPVQEHLRTCHPGTRYRTVAHLPVAHIAGVQGYLINPTLVNGTVYWMPQFEFEAYLAYNRQFEVTFNFTVPPIYLLIAKSPLVTDQLSSWIWAISGGAPMGRELQIAASARLGKAGSTFIAQTWGLSETTGSLTNMIPGWREPSGSVSSLIANHVARCVDEQDRDVAVGEPGEVIVKGPCVTTQGYFNNTQANADAYVAGGWFRTGDIAVFKHGLFYIVDRKKEMIKYKGNQVAPAELEALLVARDDVLDAAVIGLPQPDGNELPRAYIVRAPRTAVSEVAIQDYVRERVANVKHLRGGVKFVPEIPRGPSGKILRKDLREAERRQSGAKL